MNQATIGTLVLSSDSGVHQNGLLDLFCVPGFPVTTTAVKPSQHGIPHNIVAIDNYKTFQLIHLILCEVF